MSSSTAADASVVSAAVVSRPGAPRSSCRSRRRAQSTAVSSPAAAPSHRSTGAQPAQSRGSAGHRARNAAPQQPPLSPTPLHSLSELPSETSAQASQVPLSPQNRATSRKLSSQSAWLEQQPRGLDGHWARNAASQQSPLSPTPLHVLSELRSETSAQASQVPLSLQKYATSRETSHSESQSACRAHAQPRGLDGLDGHWARNAASQQLPSKMVLQFDGVMESQP